MFDDTRLKPLYGKVLSVLDRFLLCLDLILTNAHQDHSRVRNPPAHNERQTS